MKPLYLILILAFAAASCTPKNQAPEQVVADYLQALKDEKWAKAKALGTESTRAQIDGMKDTAQVRITAISEIACMVRDRGAKCEYCCREDQKSVLYLRKVGEKWFVNDSETASMEYEMRDSDTKEK